MPRPRVGFSTYRTVTASDRNMSGMPHMKGSSPVRNMGLTKSGTTKSACRSSLPTASKSARTASTVPPRYRHIMPTLA